MYFSLLSDELVPVDVHVDDTMIHVRFDSGLEIATPVSRFPRLANAESSQRERWRKIGRGDGIHWPDVDEDISIRTLLSQPKRKPISRIEEVPALIGDLLKTTKRLNYLFKGRPFTPDGHLVGSIGEVVAEYIYDLVLEVCSAPQVDARTRDGRTVQIKLTGASGRSYGFRWSRVLKTTPPEILIALKLNENGFEEIYNGNFPSPLLLGRKDSTNGQLTISVTKLRDLNPKLLKQKETFASVNRWFTSELAEVA